MKNSYKKLIIFDIILAIVLLLNSFILNILSNYYYMDIFLIILLIVFKILFGFEKDRHRYIKDIIGNIIIILLIFFIVYYIFGIFIGFYEPKSFLNYYGLKTFIIPYIIMIISREYLRVQMLTKSDKSKILTALTFLIFVFLELSVSFTNSNFSTNYNIFLFIALTVLPIISNNIACTYIAKKVGCKPVIIWLLVIDLYSQITPIVPNVGPYIQSLIRLLFPFILVYNVHSFFEKRARNVPISYVKKRIFLEIPALAIIVFTLAYFVSGYFKYYAVAVATGSMYPKINIGDVVIVNQHTDYKKLKKGQIIAYKYGNIVIVHRLHDIVIVGDDYYFYTKGDNNENKDEWIVYPNTILGTVNVKVPYIGLPTVWLNRLFE